MKKALPVIVIILIVIGVLVFINSSGSQQIQKKSNTSNEVVTPTSQVDSREKIYQISDVAQHASAEDCWMVIDGGVYDVTKFIASNMHPGGNSILRGCGKDASKMFSKHPERARRQLAEYKIGSFTAQ